MTVCPVCTSDSLDHLPTYKHVWTQCNDCGNVFRSGKDAYPLGDGVVERTLRAANERLSGKLSFLVHDLLRDEEVAQSQDAYYAYYDRIRDAKQTKWDGELEAITGELDRLGIDCRGKRVLDVSGGPGFFAQEMTKLAACTVVTEFNPAVVAAMTRELGVEAVRFDYHTDSLRTVVTREFDVVFIRNSINYCRDLERFVRELSSVLAPGGVVYVSFMTPSLGSALQSQFDEYTYDVLYQPETLRRLFASIGMHPLAPTRFAKYNPYTYYASGGYMDPEGKLVPAPTLGASLKAKLRYAFRTPFWALYGLPALLPHRNFNREILQKPCVQVYRGEHDGARDRRHG